MSKEERELFESISIKEVSWKWYVDYYLDDEWRASLGAGGLAFNRTSQGVSKSFTLEEFIIEAPMSVKKEILYNIHIFEGYSGFFRRPAG